MARVSETVPKPVKFLTGRSVGAVLIAGLALYVWFAHQLPAYLATVAPETALMLNASDATALVELADEKLRRTDSATPGQVEKPELLKWSDIGRLALKPKSELPLAAGERQQITADLTRVLQSRPLSARGFEILGRLAELDGDRVRADIYMRAAVNRSAGSTDALVWLIRDATIREDADTALRYTDILLRKRPQTGDQLFPVLAYVAERSSGGPFPATEAQKKLIELLAGEPRWRANFFGGVVRHIHDARTPLVLMTALRETEAPATAQEINGYLNFLIQKRLYSFAYYVWLQFIDKEHLAEVGFLTNGSFDVQPSGAPFDWAIAGGSGVSIDTVERIDADGDRALYLEFGAGRAKFRGVSQITVLSAGRYKLSGRLQGELSGRRGMVWRMRCLPTNKVIAESPMFLAREPNWTPFEADIEVPAEDCSAQEVRLVLDARSASEELISGYVWYDALKIRRQDDEEQ
ncbi:hypothetical protein [Hyphomicrobium sp. D-2]|uniref:hypothetical protein n=1 Tax=Hyphomicrobium sp. D-2 TaxID=3041621 RepID=UPI0024571432|nr:hypothetical protein [Hyphomicrobium sp. D-2]MDH4980686.1 hypothetical protein [Hyphomicrobium sp. D-2]